MCIKYKDRDNRGAWNATSLICMKMARTGMRGVIRKRFFCGNTLYRGHYSERGNYSLFMGHLLIGLWNSTEVRILQKCGMLQFGNKQDRTTGTTDFTDYTDKTLERLRRNQSSVRNEILVENF